MGCSAFKGGAPQQRREEEEVSDPPVVATTWATKTADAIPAAGSTSPTKVDQSSSQKKKGRSDMVLSDADDDDEIEIIYETNPKQQTQQQRPQGAQVIPAAANAQEAPEFEADEFDSRQKKLEKNSWMEQKPEPKQEPLPMTKSQQEAAAKLAESRKKFDNQRYQREQSASEAIPFNAPPAQISKEPSPAQGDKKIFHTPMASDMVFGLNQAQSSSTYATSQAANYEMIPGGIIDDYEPIQHVPISNKKKVGHDDVESTGFDIDDEKLMAEILEDFDS